MQQYTKADARIAPIYLYSGSRLVSKLDPTRPPAILRVAQKSGSFLRNAQNSRRTGGVWFTRLSSSGRLADRSLPHTSITRICHMINRHQHLFDPFRPLIHICAHSIIFNALCSYYYSLSKAIEQVRTQAL